MKPIITTLFILLSSTLFAQQGDLTYLSSGGKLKPLQAIMDIKHYDIKLNVDIANKTIQGNTVVNLILKTKTHLKKIKKKANFLFEIFQFFYIQTIKRLLLHY